MSTLGSDAQEVVVPRVLTANEMPAWLRDIRGALAWKGVVRVTGGRECMHPAAELVTLTVQQNPELSLKFDVELRGAFDVDLHEYPYSVLMAVPTLTALIYDSEYGGRYDENGQRVDVVVQQEETPAERWVGRIKSFNHNNAFGFIECEPAYVRYNRDVFLHATQMKDFVVGDVVNFRVRENSQGKPQADDLQVA